MTTALSYIMAALNYLFNRFHYWYIGSYAVLFDFIALLIAIIVIVYVIRKIKR